MHHKQKKGRGGLVALVVILLALAAGAVLFFVLRPGGDTPPASSGGASSSQPGTPGASSDEPPVPSSSGGPQAAYTALPLPEEMRAMWISYLEWMEVDISTEAALRAAAGEMMDNCRSMGLNTVIVAVRPFSDALYESGIYPWSHLLTGTQGQNPGYDPLDVLVQEAHARGLRIEAWLNPYRVKRNEQIPGALAENNPAVLHPEWAKTVGAEMWYNPALPEVQQMVVNGVREIVLNYEVDGISIDDYFYPAFPDAATGEAFDEAEFAAMGEGRTLADWRRDNVNTLMADMYAAVKEANPTVSFGISPQGNNENNYNTQYSDVNKWLATPGYADYIMPQIYWGFGYRTQSGRDDAAFANKTAEWAGYPRHADVKLYAALGAYRIGEWQPDGTRKNFGDGGYGDQAEWESGHNLADMVAHLRTVGGFSGFSLFRYDFLYTPGDPLAAQEVAALAQQLAQ